MSTKTLSREDLGMIVREVMQSQPEVGVLAFSPETSWGAANDNFGFVVEHGECYRRIGFYIKGDTPEQSMRLFEALPGELATYGYATVLDAQTGHPFVFSQKKQ